MSTRTTAANGWKIIHQARVKDPRSGEYDGQWLGWDGRAEWIVGRQFTGTEPDGFDKAGGWWYSHYFISGTDHQNRVRAVTDYLDMAKRTTHVWTSIFEQRLREEIDRHLAGRVPFTSDAELAAGWSSPSGVGGSTNPMAPVDAKRYLLEYLRTSHVGPEANWPKSGVADYEAAEGLVVGAGGPIRFEFGGNTYWLSA